MNLLRDFSAQPLSVGVSTGLTFAAVFGGKHRSFISAIGDTANVASRLMTAADAGTTLIDHQTAIAGGKKLRVDQPLQLAVKNRSDPIDAVRFQELLGAEHSFDHENQTPLVGRDDVLAAGEQLLGAASRMDAGNASGVLHLAGEPGSGKSRIAAEIARRAHVRGMTVRVGGFELFGVGRPLGPFAELVRERPGLRPISSNEDLVSAIATTRPGDENLAPLVSGLLGFEVKETAATAGLSEEQRSELGRRLLVDLIIEPTSPTLLILEDLHWADEASRHLLTDLARKAPGTSLVVLTTRRPMRIPGCEPVLELGEMSSEMLATIVRDTWSQLGGADLPLEYIDTFVERAAGSPMFAQTVTELVRRSFRPGVPLPPVPIPSEFLPFLTTQIDALSDSAQATALIMAIAGRPVTREELAGVLGGDSNDLLKNLEALASVGIVRPVSGGDVSRFGLRHATVSEALVSRASHAARAPVHEKFARYLAGIDASAREIASHLEHCSVPELALSYYRLARQEAWGAWALEEALHWASLAWTAGPEVASEADAIGLAELEQQLGNLREATERLTGLEGAEAERLRGRIALELGNAADAVAHLERAERLGASGAEE